MLKKRFTDGIAMLGMVGVGLSSAMNVCMADPGQASNAGAVQVEHPNILYIYTDDQSYRTVGCYPGSRPWVKTPNIDALAKKGVRFSHCYTGSWCMASRASMMTGLFQHAIDIKITRYPLAEYGPKVTPFWPKNFREKGYYTSLIGKWHLGEDIGHGREWDYSVVWDRAGKGNAWTYTSAKQRVRYNGGEHIVLGKYPTDKYTDLAVDFIKDKKKKEGKPWFLWLCYDGVHAPFHPAERHVDAYADVAEVKIPKDVFGPRPRKPKHMQDSSVFKKDDAGKPAKRGKTLEQRIKKYNSAVCSLDEGVGRLIKALKTSEQFKNTLVIFTSDQGYSMGEHGQSTKWLPYDATIRAPMIVSWPGHVAENKVCKYAINGTDITRTIHAIANISPPWKMHGRDFSPLLKTPDAKWAVSPMLMMQSKYTFGPALNKVLKDKKYNKMKYHGSYAWLMRIDGHMKYIRYMKDDCIEELYDLDKDPDELHNLAVSIEYQKTLKQFRERAVEEFKQNDGEFVDLLPEPKTRIAAE